MSLDIRLDRTNDLALSSRNDLVFVDGAERIRQQVKVTLLTFIGEWFLDITWGVPYFDKIMVKSPDRAQIEAIIRAKVKDVPGVRSVPIVEVEIDNETRQGRITLPDIQTDEGLITVTVTQ